MKDIFVSVIMPVYNTKENYLRKAMSSILEQTHREFEFIIINDCSEEWCSNILKEYADPRIKIYNNEKNMGVAKSLNKGLKLATGKYIFRMDSDDVSTKSRIELQIAYMEKYKEIDVLAGVTNIIGTDNFSGICRDNSNETKRIQLLFGNIEFPHPTVVFRKDFLTNNNLFYDENLKNSEDYYMWIECADRGNIAIIQRQVLFYRDHEQKVGRVNKNEEILFDKEIKKKSIRKLIPDCSQREEELFVHFKDVKLYGDVTENLKLISKLIYANEQKNIYNQTKFKRYILFWWFKRAFLQREKRKVLEMIFNRSLISNKSVLLDLLVEFYVYVLDNMYRKRFVRLWEKESKVQIYDL